MPITVVNVPDGISIIRGTVFQDCEILYSKEGGVTDTGSRTLAAAVLIQRAAKQAGDTRTLEMAEGLRQAVAATDGDFVVDSTVEIRN
jgi:hypothetical protein